MALSQLRAHLQGIIDLGRALYRVIAFDPGGQASSNAKEDDMTAITTATDEHGNKYVKTRTIGDATITVVSFETAMRGDTLIWTSAVYEVKSGSKKGKKVIRTKGGTFWVPEAKPPLKNATIRQAIDASLGRPLGTLPEPARTRSAKAGK